MLAGYEEGLLACSGIGFAVIVKLIYNAKKQMRKEKTLSLEEQNRLK